MTSTRVIRGFKVDTTKAANRVTVLPTPQKLTADIGNFQDIGAKIVRPRSRKEQSWLARSKGLRTSEGLAQQLVKEEGIKIKIGDSTLKQLLQVEVPEMRKQEYIKADGSVGVRKVPVLDAKGNPVLVKKNLSIPGTMEHFQKPIKEKLDNMELILKDLTKSSSEKLEALVILGADLLLDPTRPREVSAELVNVLSRMPQLPDNVELIGFPEGLIDGHIATKGYIMENLPLVQIYLINKARKRGLNPNQPIKVVSEFKDASGKSIIKENKIDFDEIKKLQDDEAIDLSTSIAATIDDLTKIIAEEDPFAEFKEFKEEPFPLFEPEPFIEEDPFAIEPIEFGKPLEEFEPFVEPTLGMMSRTIEVARLREQLTDEQRADIDVAEFNKLKEPEKKAFLETILESAEEFEEEVPLGSENIHGLIFTPSGNKEDDDRIRVLLDAKRYEIMGLDSFKDRPKTEIKREDIDKPLSELTEERIDSNRKKQEALDDARSRGMSPSTFFEEADLLTRQEMLPYMIERYKYTSSGIGTSRDAFNVVGDMFPDVEEIIRERFETTSILERFVGDLPEDEQKAFNSLVIKGLKKPGDEGRITIPNQQKASLTKFLSGGFPKPGREAIRNLNKVLFTKVNVLQNLNEEEIKILRDLNDSGLIQGGGKVGLEGRGMPIDPYKMYSSSGYGYAKPSYSLQQKMMCC